MNLYRTGIIYLLCCPWRSPQSSGMVSPPPAVNLIESWAVQTPVAATGCARLASTKSSLIWQISEIKIENNYNNEVQTFQYRSGIIILQYHNLEYLMSI